jgi:hypothetical protein
MIENTKRIIPKIIRSFDFFVAGSRSRLYSISSSSGEVILLCQVILIEDFDMNLRLNSFPCEFLLGKKVAFYHYSFCMFTG